MGLLSIFKRDPQTGNGRKPYEHRATFVPKWRSVPDAVAEEYQSGLPLLELVARHHSNIDDIRTKLVSLGVKIRPKGWRTGWREYADTNSKLSKEQIKWAIEQDDNDVSHSEIARAVGVTRERIRQICLLAGRPQRRARLLQFASEKAEGLEIARAEKERASVELRERLSKLYKEGASFVELAAVAGWKGRKRAATLIAQYRKRFPDLFPYRARNHWTFRTPTERVQHLQRLSEEWKKGTSTEKMAEKLGYKNRLSIESSIITARFNHPEMFPKRAKGRRQSSMPDIATLETISEQWRSGKHYYEIARTMGYANPRTLYNSISRWRKVHPEMFPTRTEPVHAEKASSVPNANEKQTASLINPK